jgi:hypothetical protein
MSEPVGEYRAGVVKHNDPYSRISAQIAQLRAEVLAHDAITLETVREMAEALRIIAVIAQDAPPTPAITEIRGVLARLAQGVES